MSLDAIGKITNPFQMLLTMHVFSVLAVFLTLFARDTSLSGDEQRDPEMGAQRFWESQHVPMLTLPSNS